MTDQAPDPARPSDRFTLRQFELLADWGGRAWNRSTEELAAYDELKAAHRMTAKWAERLEDRLFPGGRTDGRLTVINQGQRFQPYTWKRIYPRADALCTLAYTVGIDAGGRAIVKVDTYKPPPALRRRYEAMREPTNGNAPCAATMPAAEACAMTLDGLVYWSEAAILDFKIGYEQAEQILGLIPPAMAPLGDVDEVRAWVGKWRAAMDDGAVANGRVRWAADVGVVFEHGPLENGGTGTSLGSDPSGRRWPSRSTIRRAQSPTIP